MVGTSRIIKLDLDKVDRKKVIEVAQVIKSGGVIVCPTDTIYGLSGSPLIPESVERIYKIKGRAEHKPLLLLIADVSWVARVAEEVPPTFYPISEKFWPGPLTIVLKARESVPSILTAGTGNIGVRVPNHPFVLELLKECDSPIISTSANLSEGENIVQSSKIIELFQSRVDLIVDAGDLESAVESTVVSLVGNELKLLREGRIKFNEISATFNP